ncbi:MAG: 3'(2'),5'-bisphosphate nucleotidase CysQ family protein [Plesiomonas shigelloides]
MAHSLDHPLYQPNITDLEPIARAAGAAIMAIYREPFAVAYKDDESPLTAADKAAHNLIVQGLTQLTPAIPVLSEESDLDVMAARHGWSRYWLVDPLDGTKEFIAGNGEFTVNIALIEEGSPRWGLVYGPVLDTLWYGGRGLGAWRIAKGVCTAIESQPHRSGQVWRVLGSRNHLSQETLDYLARIGNIKQGDIEQGDIEQRNIEQGNIEQGNIEQGEITLIAMGSSLKFCLIAEGGADLYPRLAPTCEWDTAAAQAVLEGAGGSVTQLDGSPLRYNKADILNPWFVAKG